MRRVSMLLLVLAVAFVGSLPGEAQQSKNITWTAGQVGGGWYSQAGGFVELIKSKDPSFNIKVILVSYTDLANQYRDRNMDILFANLAVPGAAIQEASLGRKMRILPMDDDLIKFMEGVGLTRGVIPKGSYKDVVNNDVDIPTIAMANTIVANAKVPADVVHDFTKVLVSNVDGVRKVHPAFKDFDPKDAPKLSSLPLHPGAERAYREAGLLK